MTSNPHECGARAVRKVFEPRMEALQSKYGGYWKYNTNCRVRLLETKDDETEEAISLPTTLERTPDGGIADASGLLLPNEVSAAQTHGAASERMQMFFNNPSVIAGIVLNIDETPPYASPVKASDWDSDEGPVKFTEWGAVGLEPWEPIMFAGYCWGGAISCQIDIYWASVEGAPSFTAVSHHSILHN